MRNDKIGPAAISSPARLKPLLSTWKPCGLTCPLSQPKPTSMN